MKPDPHSPSENPSRRSFLKKAALGGMVAGIAGSDQAHAATGKDSTRGHKGEGRGDAVQKVDALSGATPSYLQEELVEGAAYTCYTMWHWANGNTATRIRAHSQDQGSPEWLQDLLGSGSDYEVDFALEAIARRKLHDKAMQDSVIAAAKDSSTEGYRIVLDYLADANPGIEERYAAYLELMRNATGPHRAQLLEQLLRQADAPPLAGLEPMAAQLMDFERFYELQLFLNLANRHPDPSEPTAHRNRQGARPRKLLLLAPCPRLSQRPQAPPRTASPPRTIRDRTRIAPLILILHHPKPPSITHPKKNLRRP
jgi:hypothetical protein